jgi:hypothetical protein
MTPVRRASGPTGTPTPNPSAASGWQAAPLWRNGTGRPAVAVLAPRWATGSEEAWITRQVAGALACVADVHVVTPQGDVPRDRIESVFAVHELASPVPPLAELQRDLLVEAVTATGGIRDGRIPAAIGSLLDRGLVDPWVRAADVLSALRPDAVVIAGHEQVGALAAVDEAVPDVPLTLLALGVDPDSLAFPHFDPLFDRAASVLAVSEGERAEIVEHHGGADKVHVVGAPMAANPSALSEPSPWVGTTEYVIVLTDADSNADEEVVELSRLIRLRFPEHPVGISYTDVFVVWHEGRWVPGWPVERASDLARLMGFARAVVDLHPGPLFARRCVDSLLYGVPIIVPAESRARQHAELGGGGLWFSTPGELTWCIDALLRPEVREPFSHQGRAYAEERYGSTDRFVDRVVAAVGIAGDRGPAPVPVPATS